MMPHCDPAPPHPEPGQIYNAICLPSMGEIAVLVGLFAAIVLLVWALGRMGGSEDGENVGGEA